MKHFFLSVATAASLLAAINANAQPGGWHSPWMDGDNCGPGRDWMMSGDAGRGQHRGAGWGGPMGPGMMGDGRYWALDLSQAQRDKILSIERASSGKQWELMSKMHDQRLGMHERYVTGKWDEDAQRKNYQVMSELHKAMFENSLQSRKDIEAVLTPEQRAQLGQAGRGRPGAR